jgi:hypothetical protein
MKVIKAIEISIPARWAVERNRESLLKPHRIVVTCPILTGWTGGEDFAERADRSLF